MGGINEIRGWLRGEGWRLRALPFLVFVVCTSFQGILGPLSIYWVYAVKTLIGVGLLWLIWPLVGELRWRLSGLGLVVGVGVLVMWVGLDPYYPRLGGVGGAGWGLFVKVLVTGLVIFVFWPLFLQGGGGKPGVLEWGVLVGVVVGIWVWWEPFGGAVGKGVVHWKPLEDFTGERVWWGWFLIGVRWLGSSLVVPPMEELFYRSFLGRYLEGKGVETAVVGVESWRGRVGSAVIFGFAHTEWLAGVLCGLAYQYVVVRTGRLGDAMFAHAVTNALLGGWVVFGGAWRFW